MTKEDIIRKLTSRKLWAAIASFVSMLVVAFHGTEETATQIAALIMAGATVIAYIVGEGMIDAAGAQTLVVPVQEEAHPPEEEEQ